MWDGGIVTILTSSPLAPLTAPNEMGETLANTLHKLQQDTGYERMFAAAFSDRAITTQRMNRALSQYMLMLVSANSKYDKVMRGEAELHPAGTAGVRHHVLSQKMQRLSYRTACSRTFPTVIPACLLTIP